VCPRTERGGEELKSFDENMTELEHLWIVKCPNATIVRKRLRPEQNLADIGFPLTAWTEFDYVQIACHGVFPPNRPLDAALHLGSDAVRAAELFAVRLRARLFALSACSLGRQEESEDDSPLGIDEWVGMYLPLFSGGAGAVLASLWDADANTAARFMSALHTALAAKANPTQAFRAGCRAMTRRWPLWANWYLVGVPELNFEEGETCYD
jgi:CHAT domain-containing protein